MSLSIEDAVAGGSNGYLGGAFQLAVTGVLTSGPNRVLVAHITLVDGGYKTVASISDTAGLTWALRKRVQVTDANGAFINTEVWWAHATSQVSSETATITLAQDANTQTVIIFAVAGCGTPSSPWDVNASLPASASGTTSGTPSVSSVSTTAASTALLQFISGSNEGSGKNPIVLGTGFTDSGVGTKAEEPGAGNKSSAEMAGYDIVSAAQSGITVTGGDSLQYGWIEIVDAIVGGALVPPSAFGTVMC